MGVLANPKAFAQEVSKGLQTLTMATLRAYSPQDLKGLLTAIEIVLREIRAEQIPPDDVMAMKDKNQRIIRLNSAMAVVRGYCKQRKIII